MAQASTKGNMVEDVFVPMNIPQCNLFRTAAGANGPYVVQIIQSQPLRYIKPAVHGHKSNVQRGGHGDLLRGRHWRLQRGYVSVLSYSPDSL
jgi:hypothetical protein